MRRLTLFEHRTTPEVPLSSDERDALMRAIPSLAVSPSVGREGRYDLTPGSRIGAINLLATRLAVEIRPKVPVSRVMFMVSYTLDPASWREQAFDLPEEGSLLEAVVPVFVSRVRQALRPGVLEGYRTEEATLPTVRGRLRLDEQMRRRFGPYPPAEVVHDEFTEDVEEDRLLKAALLRLGRMRFRAPEARRSLGHLDAVLERVSPVG